MFEILEEKFSLEIILRFSGLSSGDRTPTTYQGCWWRQRPLWQSSTAQTCIPWSNFVIHILPLVVIIVAIVFLLWMRMILAAHASRPCGTLDHPPTCLFFRHIMQWELFFSIRQGPVVVVVGRIRYVFEIECRVRICCPEVERNFCGWFHQLWDPKTARARSSFATATKKGRKEVSGEGSW